MTTHHLPQLGPPFPPADEDDARALYGTGRDASSWAVPQDALSQGPTTNQGERDPFTHELLARMARLPNGARQALADSLWGRIPATYWENGYSAAGTAINSVPRTENMVRVTTIIASVPSGATGLVQLADVIIPIGTGLSVIPFGTDGGIMLARSDTRQVTATSSGPIALVLSGQLAPTYAELT